MNNRKWRVLFVMLFMALGLLAAPAGRTSLKVQAASGRSRVYRKRARKVKKNLPKKVKKLLKKSYYKPSCRVAAARRKGAYMTCQLSGSIGGGAYVIKVIVNLKNGRVMVTENMVDIPNRFKVSLR